MMSTRYDGSHYENHQRAAELHDIAAHAHRTAAEHHGKQDHQIGQERSRQALEHSLDAYRHMRTLDVNLAQGCLRTADFDCSRSGGLRTGLATRFR